MTEAVRLKLDPDGAQLFADALSEAELIRVEAATADPVDVPGRRLACLRDIADLLAADGTIGSVAYRFFSRQACAVRAILFNKRLDLNWGLALHQDRTIAVRERVDVPGFGPWSIKAGQPHVEPPQEITARMVTLRVHLDHVDEDNAPLVVLPSSHELGRLSETQIEALAREPTVSCLARRGDIWAYRTAIVHGSAPSQAPNRRRRVLQIDYSADPLPGGLDWAPVG